jgi:transposase InsO family protein
MVGRGTMPPVPRPFVAYLRVYEPLSAFAEPVATWVRETLELGHLEYADIGEHERDMWLRSQLSQPTTMLPGELANGEPSPRALRDVLVLDPAEVPVESATVGPGPLICPLDVRARAAAALVGFLTSSHPALQAVALTASLETVRDKAADVLSDLPGGAVHIVSTTWTVPLPWFTLVDPEHRHIEVATRDDARRHVCWRVAMADARRRVAKAHALAERVLGDQGPTKVLDDTGRWLEHFHPHSAVELDYGGLVQLLDDEEMVEDTSAADVNAIVAALDREDVEEIAARFERLREFWGELAVRERFN